MSVREWVLAIDIGGTKMAAAVVDRAGDLVSRDRTATLRGATAEGVFEALVDLCRGVMKKGNTDRVCAIGVGCGGPMLYPAGLVSPLNIPAWRDFPLRQRLTHALNAPCVVDNDAKTLSLGEHWRGAGRGAKNMLGMVVSTGVGGGIILDGHLLHGARGNAGHVGHIVVWPNGPPCGCGARGCLEGIASGSGLARRLNAALDEGATSSVHHGATAAEIAAAARDGDALARELFRSAGECLGRGLASASAVLDIELIVIGGSIALRAWDLLGPAMELELRRAARLDFTRDVRVVQAQTGDDAGLFGAALLAFQAVQP